MEDKIQYSKSKTVFDLKNAKDASLLNVLNKEEYNKEVDNIQKEYHQRFYDVLMNKNKTMYGKVLL